MFGFTRYKFSPHALQQMEFRGLTRNDVICIVYRPVATKESYGGRMEAYGHVKGRGVKVIYAHGEIQEIWIISAMPVSRKRFPR